MEEVVYVSIMTAINNWEMNGWMDNLGRTLRKILVSWVFLPSTSNSYERSVSSVNSLVREHWIREDKLVNIQKPYELWKFYSFQMRNEKRQMSAIEVEFTSCHFNWTWEIYSDAKE